MEIEDVRNWDIGGSAVTLWFFKRPPLDEQRRPKFRGNWLDIADNIADALKEAANATVGNINEINAYGLLAQTQEGQALEIQTDETHAALLIEQMQAELQSNQITDVKGIYNSLAYAAKFVVGERTIFGIKKLDSSWSTKRSTGLIPAALVEDTLTLANTNTFHLAKDFDFFATPEDILVWKKAAFETVLFYKETHIQDFGLLVGDPAFSDIFADTVPLTTFVGDNKLHLRRASAIRQKAHYADEDFMANLRARHAEYHLIINFDDAGRIIPCAETCRDIFNALLDHRLKSGFSENIYSVPDASPA